MRKFCVAILTAILSFGALSSLRAETDADAREMIRDIVQGRNNANQIRALRVRDSVTVPDGSIPSASIASGAISGDKLASGAISQVDSANTTTTSLYTATSVGQLLFGKAGGSGRVWRASALTSTNWVLVLQSSL